MPLYFKSLTVVFMFFCPVHASYPPLMHLTASSVEQPAHMLCSMYTTIPLEQNESAQTCVVPLRGKQRLRSHMQGGHVE